MKAKHQRLILAVLAVVAVIGAGLLTLSALKDQASFFYAPSDVAAHPPTPDKAVRLGGLVETGSLRKLPDGVSITFTVTDGKASVPVRFTGVTPDLFREGAGVVAEGSFQADGSFVATDLLAKQDEKYTPPPLVGKVPASEGSKL